MDVRRIEAAENIKILFFPPSLFFFLIITRTKGASKAVPSRVLQSLIPRVRDDISHFEMKQPLNERYLKHLAPREDLLTRLYRVSFVFLRSKHDPFVTQMKRPFSAKLID